MANGFRRSRKSGDYVFVDGRAVHAPEDDARVVAVPGQEAAGTARPPFRQAPPSAGAQAPGGAALDQLRDADALELREDAVQNLAFAAPERLYADDRRKLRRRCAVFGAVLFVVTCVSLCISEGYDYTLYSPADVAACYGSAVQLLIAHLFDPAHYAEMRYEVMAAYSMYLDVLSEAGVVLKYLACGTLLALSGMLYQNAFRNPIAAPTMLGVSSGMNFALLILVLMYGYAALSMTGLYIVYSFVGGAVILVLVMAGGRLISGKGKFNVVNLLLMGTIVSQLLGVVMQWVENMVFTDTQWVAYYELQNAVATTSDLTYITLAIGFVVSVVPVIALRFRMNLISFDDAETRLLGVNPNKLRILALTCGSIMVLTAQVNAGQVAMVSLVVPFIARHVFGSEFRKQLVGNVLVGSLVLLVCGDFVSFVYIAAVPLELGGVVTVLAMPLFVWMLVIQQKSWR